MNKHMLSAPRAEVKLLQETCDYLPSEHNSHFTMKNPSLRLPGTTCLDIGSVLCTKEVQDIEALRA